jgi:hypothetical protein
VQASQALFQSICNRIIHWKEAGVSRNQIARTAGFTLFVLCSLLGRIESPQFLPPSERVGDDGSEMFVPRKTLPAL